VADAARRLDDLSGGRVSNAYRYYRKLRNPQIGTTAAVGRQLAGRDLPGISLSRRQLRAALDEADTVGAQVRLLRSLRRVDTDLSDLSETESRRLSRILQDTGDEGVEFIDDVDRSTVLEFLGRCRVSGGSPSVAGTGILPAVRSPSAQLSAARCWSGEFWDKIENTDLDYDESARLWSTLKAYEGIADDTARNPTEILDDIERLANEDVEGLERTIRRNDQ